MRSFIAAIVLGGAVLGSGCASDKHAKVLDPVGPSSFGSGTAGAKGTLVVYSALDPNSDFTEVPSLREHTDYAIFSERGQLLQTVHNNDGSVLEAPKKVELPVGEYRITARANGYKTVASSGALKPYHCTVTVPVIVMANQITTVHLEGGASWPDNAALLQSNPVRLPGGEIVGWRANTELVSRP